MIMNAICGKAEIKKKVLHEIDSLLLPYENELMLSFTLELADQLIYPNYCYMETLRMDPPVSLSNSISYQHPVKAAGLNIRKGDAIYLNIEQLHYDPVEWQNPTEFIPERFDAKELISKRADKSRRHTHSYMPYSFFRRSFDARQFGEMITRISMPLILFHWDFEFTKAEHKANKPRYMLNEV
jgi:cytochrome P450